MASAVAIRKNVAKQQNDVAFPDQIVKRFGKNIHVGLYRH